MQDSDCEPRWRQAESRYRDEATGHVHDSGPRPIARHDGFRPYLDSAPDDYHTGRDFSGIEG